ncbi:MAG: tyrosine phenol-lyase, partial [Gammaproteobacteria bacterium]|nr:tyrosine phenol-lyase [Gammaproteobacteria bacterium]
LTIPRRVYTQAHMDVTVGAVKEVMQRRNEIHGLRFTYEPEMLRFFQARFETIA